MYEQLRVELETEARAKITWGEDIQEVTNHLISNGYERQEAEALILRLKQEREATIRKTGTKRILLGVPCIVVPFVAYAIFIQSPIFPMKAFGVTIAVGVFGAWKVMSGVLNILFPHMESGDLGERSRV
jgi:hypothetical protein